MCQNQNDILQMPDIEVKPFIYKDLTMSLQPLPSERFIRKTRLAPNEYRKNFHQIDRDIMLAVTSAEADKVTPLMSKIYLRLVSAPTEFWEREGVLYFAPRDEAGRLVKASKVLYAVLGVASATAHKALQWLHEQGIIGYFAGKNGVGIRIFLNRAATSIGVREGSGGKKILPFARGSNDATHGSTVESAFKDSFADLETLDSDIDPRAPESGADSTSEVNTAQRPTAPLKRKSYRPNANEETDSKTVSVLPLDEITDHLLRGLEPAVCAAAAEAAAREHERTRAWLESKGLPKAARVAQREAYNLLRQYGVIKGRAQPSPAHDEVESREQIPPASHVLSDDDITELAYCCIALLEAQGRPVERTLSEMSVEAGGCLLPNDVAKVRATAGTLLAASKNQHST